MALKNYMTKALSSETSPSISYVRRGLAGCFRSSRGGGSILRAERGSLLCSGGSLKGIGPLRGLTSLSFCLDLPLHLKLVS